MAPGGIRLALQSLLLLPLVRLLGFSHEAVILTVRKISPSYGALVTPNKLPGKWAYVNCYTFVPLSILWLSSPSNRLNSDSVGSRALTGAAYTDGKAMTDEACVNYCDGLGYGYAGTEYSSECCKLATDSPPPQSKKTTTTRSNVFSFGLQLSPFLKLPFEPCLTKENRLR